jgi:hypothetical protein
MDTETGAVGLSELRVFPRHGRDALPDNCDRCLQLEPTQTPPTAYPLTATALRDLRFGELQRQATNELQRIAPVILPSPRAFQSVAKQRRGARRQRYLAYVAALYERACVQSPRRPYAALSKTLKVERRTLYDNLRAARELGITKSAGQGRAGGELTRKGRRLYEEYLEMGDA